MTSTIKVDPISENTSANGVAIDGVTIKDSVVLTDTISEKTSANGVAVDGVTLKDGNVGAAGTATSVAGIPFYSIGGNSIYTHDVSGTDDTAAQNAAYGFGALDAVTTGDHNTAIGYGALTSNTTGARNIALGRVALDAPDTENDNLAIGYNALAGAINGGEFNVAIGNNSLDALTSGDNNTAVGYNAGTSMTDGGNATLIGFEAGKALQGNDLTAVGFKAGTATTAANNTFIGVNAGLINAGGDSNIGIGKDAYDNADAENHNLAIGRNALGGAVNGGEYNVAVGNQTLDAVTSGDSNTAVGYNAGTSINSGGQNTLYGESAGGSITTGAGNVCIGQNAGNAGTILVSGNNCIYIGQAIRGTGEANNSEIVIGSLNVTGKGGQTAFINPDGGTIFNGGNTTAFQQTSDRRIKKNIVDNNIGLEAINKIQVRNFEYRTLEEITDFDNPEAAAAAVVDKQGTQLGLIAQEIEEILPELVNTETTGVKTLNSNNLTWYLINAVKELSAEIKALKGE